MCFSGRKGIFVRCRGILTRRWTDKYEVRLKLRGPHRRFFCWGGYAEQTHGTIHNREEAGRMKLSCVLLLNLALFGLAPSAVALDATTRPLRRGKAAHLVQPRRAVKQSAKTVATRSAATAHASSRSVGNGRAAGKAASSI